jgi:Bacterial transglutaminase-like cysteine proteinase BTLCP
MRVPTTAFGPGSRQNFGHYIEGESGVRVASIDEIVEWLQSCEYVTDTDLFHERDVWQHPAAFEQLRRGDCEDFALWAWRKLAEIDVEAEFYVGRVVCGDDPSIDRQHAWVVYRIDGDDYLFEPAAQSRPRMIRPLAEAMNEYVPHFAVNRKLGTSAFVGCILDSHRDRQRRRGPAETP